MRVRHSLAVFATTLRLRPIEGLFALPESFAGIWHQYQGLLVCLRHRCIAAVCHESVEMPVHRKSCQVDSNRGARDVSVAV